MMQFKDNQQAAQALYRYTRDAPELRYLMLHSERGRAAATGDWWLAPSRAWPVHRHGKLLLRRCPDAPTLMFAGLQVEKGLGRQLPGLVDDALIMTPQWYWHTFVNEVLAGMLTAPLRSVSQITGLPVVVGVEVYPLTPDTNLVRDSRRPTDRVLFTVRASDLVFRTDVLSTDILVWLNGTVNVQDLVGRLLALPKVTWYWISVRLGVRVAYDAGAWDAGVLWNNVFAPWLRWVR